VAAKITVLKWIILGVGSVMLVTGCNALGPPKSGFLGDYSGFVKDERHMGVWIYHSPTATYGDYDRVMIDPFVLGFSHGKQGVLATAQELDKLAATMHDYVAKIVAERYPVVDKPGNRTLRLRIALTDIRPSTGPDSAEAASGVLSHVGVQLGGSSFEGEAVDSMTGKRVHAFIVVDRLASSVPGGRWSQAIGVLEDFARAFRQALDDAHSVHR